MTNEWKIVGPGRSWALGSSLLFHSLILAGLGAASFQANTPEPGEMVVYFAMSSVGVSQNLQAEIPADHQAVPETARFSLVEPNSQESKVDRNEVAIESTSTVESVEINPVSKKNKMEALLQEERTKSESERYAVAEIDPFSNSEELLEATKPQVFIETSKPDSPSGIVNGSEDGVDTDHRSPITDHRLPLLAFAGDPSSLGIVVDDALVGNYVRAEAVVFPKPAYPPLSRRRGEEGRVVIKVKVSTKGEVRSAKVHSSSSYPRLDRAALAAAGKTRFSPATRWGTPVDSEWTVAYVFRLEGK